MLGGNVVLRFPLESMDQCLHPLQLCRHLACPLSAHFIIIFHFFKELIKKQDHLQIAALFTAIPTEQGLNRRVGFAHHCKGQGAFHAPIPTIAMETKPKSGPKGRESQNAFGAQNAPFALNLSESGAVSGSKIISGALHG
jgi:hypothetical protein